MNNIFDAPTYKILLWAGLIFLLLAVVSEIRFGGNRVLPGNSKLALGIGVALLFLSAFLNVLPASLFPSTAPPSQSPIIIVTTSTPQTVAQPTAPLQPIAQPQPISRPTVQLVTQATSISEPYDCTTTVSSSRLLLPNGTEDACWLKLPDGGPTELTFNESAQITYRTLTGGSDVYFYIAQKGDRLSDIVGATIRPARAISFSFGDFDAVKKFEISYHSPGYQGGWTTCLRDANNGYQPLNSLCK